MLSTADNELLVRTGPGTPMGALFRRFWNPVMLASDLGGPDSAPVRLTILGEQLVVLLESRAAAGGVGENGVAAVVEHGVDVNAFNAAGMTALHYAAQRGADSIVKLLAGRGALLDLQNKQGRTALDLSLGGSGTGRRGRGTAPVFEGTAALLRQLMESAGLATELR